MGCDVNKGCSSSIDVVDSFVTLGLLMVKNCCKRSVDDSIMSPIEWIAHLGETHKRKLLID